MGAAAFGLKKLATRQGKAASKTRINVLTNHHLGPKKNLMIVQVAGETLLLGVTDHNITMLKTLALIDDEVPAHLPQRFDQTMDDFVADEDEPIAMQGLDQIRDTVSSRLKNLRNL
jgi:flagellar protein FliO/FliZ